MMHATKAQAVILALIISSFSAMGQLSGPKSIPGDYATVALAVTDLNTQGVGAGGVTFNVAAGFTETTPAGGFVIMAQGTLANPIVFQKSGGGANPTFTAPAPQTAGNLNDGIFKLIGADYVTLDGFTLLENPANIITVAGTNDMTEWGVAVLYADTVGGGNGAQNNTIKNCTITLNRTYQNTFGVYSNSTHSPTAVTTSASGTSVTGSNSGLKLYSNDISNVNIGVVVVGPTAAAAHNDGLDVGGAGAPTGNSITNYGTTGTFSGYANVSATVNGILVRNTKAFNVSYNTVTSSVGGTTLGTLRGIYVPSFSAAPTGTFINTMNNNNISLQSAVVAGAMLGIAVEVTTSTATSTTNINNNDFNNTTHTVVASGAITLISHGGSGTAGPLNHSISNNTFTNLSPNTTGSFTFITNSWARPASGVGNINNNSIVTAFNKTGAGGTVQFYLSNSTSPATATEVNTGNNFSNVTVTGATTIAGFQTSDGGSPVKTVTGNTFSNITGGTNQVTILNVSFSGVGTNAFANTINNVTSGGIIIGISSTSGNQNIYQNTINTLSTTGASAVSGISVSGGTAQNVYKNKIYDLQSNNATGTVNGILVSGGTTVTLHNNLIGDLRAPSTSSATDAIRGINITSVTATAPRNIYYNTIYINATSVGANFSTSGLFHTYSATATTSALDMRDNIIVNTSTPAGTGITTAFRRSAATDLNNYVSTSNNNLLYAGTPGAANLIFFDGTNSDQTIAAFKSRVAPRETNSMTENPPFLSTVGSNANFLHMSTAVATQTESGGTPVVGITDDFDGNVRNVSTPDVGADEFAGIPLDVNGPSTAYTPLANTGSMAARTLTATITDPSGVPTSGVGLPVLYWRINGGSYTGATATSLGSNQYQFTLGSGVAAGDTVRYYVAAQDAVAPPNVSVQPAGGASGLTANPPAASTPPTTPSSYLITQPALSGSYTVGLALFNSVAGKNISFQKSVRKIMKEVVIPSEQTSGTREEKLAGVGVTSAGPHAAGVTQLVEVEEISWIPMENGRVYTGELYVKRNEHPELDWPDDIMGIYSTITAAVADLNLRGTSGHTTFLLVDATYPTETFPITVNVTNVAKPTATSTVTIKPNAGVTATVSGVSASSVIFKVFNTNYVTIDGSNSGGTSRDLTLENTSTTAPSVVWFGSSGTIPITNGMLKNCIVRNGINTSSAVVTSDGAALGTAGYFSNITIENNSIQKAFMGVYSTGGTAPQNGSNLVYRNNELNTTGANAIRYVGLYMQGVNGATVRGNDIGGFETTSGETDRAVWLATGSINVLVTSNKIHDLNYTGTAGYGGQGIVVSSGQATANDTIANNAIYNMTGDGDSYTSFGATFDPVGIFVFGTGQGGIHLYYNSIFLYGNTVNFSALAYSIGIALDDGAAATVKDNNVVNNLGRLGATGAGAAAIALEISSTQLIESDYNNLFSNSTGGGANVVGKIAGTDYLTMADWRTGSGKDANSISADPMYVGNTDLRPFAGSPVLAAGMPVAGITTDLLGVVRANPPSIGAYENGVSANMTYTSSTTTQNTSPVYTGTTNQQVIGIQVVTSGTVSPINANRFLLNTNGTTASSDIANARLYYTGSSGVFATGTQFGSTVGSPNGAFAINGSQVLAAGTNYFWLTYDVLFAAVPGNVVDAQCDSLYAAGLGHIPTVTAPAGNRTVTGAASIVTRPDSLVKTQAAGNSSTDTLVIKNTGNVPLTWSITDESTRPAVINETNLRYNLPGPELPKGAPDISQGDPVTDGQGGPDAFGYKWIDSDEPGGPTFSWVDIRTSGTSLDSTSGWIKTDPTSGFRPGDEGYYPVVLPFSFNYYGVAYDTLFIGTNGFCSFTRAVDDAFTDVLFPTAGGIVDNHMGAFWDDLEVRGRGRVYYGTNGGDFVVQYDSVCRFNSSVSNYTFELILSPNGSWKYQYLNMGFGAGSIITATIGMENATGTIGLTVVNNAAYMHNNLAIRFSLPDAPWLSESPASGSVNPGDSVKVVVTFNSTGLIDSTYRAVLKIASNDPTTPTKNVPARLTVSGGGGTVTLGVPVALNWNIVSLPVSAPVPDDSVKHLFTNSINPYGFAFAGGYQQRYVMVNAPGYWIKSSAAYTQDIVGTSLDNLTVPVNNGWNMIGSISMTIDTSAAHVTPSVPGLRASNYFRYSSGYVITATINPGLGYWVKASSAGSFLMHSTGASKPLAAQPSGRTVDNLNSITIQDANGGSQTLYFGADSKGEIPVAMFAMPPSPPVGSFDARFASADGGTMVQTHAEEVSEVLDLPITLQSSAYPLTISWNVGDGMYELNDGATSHPMRGEGTVKITNSSIEQIVLKVTGGSTLPKEFALSQNYPNPFNPTTSVKYALPVDSRVTMEIYNVIGQRVRTLVNDNLEAGYHAAEWNGKNNAGQQLSSGMYFLQLSAKGTNGKSFNEVRKLMLLK